MFQSVDKKYYAFPNKNFHKSNQDREQREREKSEAEMIEVHTTTHVLMASSWMPEPKQDNRMKRAQKKEQVGVFFLKKQKNKSLCHINHRHCYGCCCLLQRFILFLSWEAEGQQTLPNKIKNVKQFSVFFSAYSCFCTCMHCLWCELLLLLLFFFIKDLFCVCVILLWLARYMQNWIQLLTVHYNVTSVAMLSKMRASLVCIDISNIIIERLYGIRIYCIPWHIRSIPF